MKIFSMKHFFYAVLLLQFLLVNFVTGKENHGKAKENYTRIQELIPLPFHQFNIEPAIPEDFTAMSLSGNLDPYDWIYWGPKDVIEDYFKDPSSLSQGLIRVKLSAYVCQTGTDSFSDDEQQILANNPNASTRKTNWNGYPVLSSSTSLFDKQIECAWVGLNDRGAGWTLLFNLVYPENQNEPTEEQMEIWETFITETEKNLKK